jgi:hypothetical protein
MTRRKCIPFDQDLRPEDQTPWRKCYRRKRKKRLKEAKEYRRTHAKQIKEYREAHRVDINEYNREYRRRREKEGNDFTEKRRGYGREHTIKDKRKDEHQKKMSRKAPSELYRKKK